MPKVPTFLSDPSANGRADKIDNISPSLADLVEDIAILRYDPNNARLHPERNMDAIKESLRRYGQVKPVVARRSNCTVVAGNGTLRAALEMDWTKLAVSWVDMTDVQAVGYGLADNRASELATWNVEVVAKLHKLQEEAQDAPVGWTLDELTALRLATAEPPKVDPDEVPPEPVEPITKVGDLWLLGEHRLLCGDCRIPENVQLLMNGELATLLFTDPPYGVSVGAKNRFLNSVQPSGRCLENLDGDDLSGDTINAELWLPAFETFYSHASDDCSFFVCTAQRLELCTQMISAMQDSGLSPRHILIWLKNAPTFSMNRLDYDNKHESILFGWKKTHKRKQEGSFRTSVWDAPKPRASPDHATTKPVELPRNAILNHTDAGDIVVDIFLGSGTTLIAAEMTARRAYCIEIEPKYVDVAVSRWVAFTGKDAVRDNDSARWSELVAQRKNPQGGIPAGSAEGNGAVTPSVRRIGRRP